MPLHVSRYRSYRRRLPSWAALALLAFAGSISGQSRPPVVVSSEVVCPACRILLDTAAILLYPEGIGLAPERLSADAGGHFHAVYAEAPRRIHRHDRSGVPVAFLGEMGGELGRFGEFPDAPRPGPGDSLHIHDRRNSRVVVVSPTGSGTRAAPFGPFGEVVGVAEFLVASDGEWLAFGSSGEPSSRWSALVTDRNGMLLRSFAVPTPGAWGHLRVAAAADGTFWVALEHPYRIARWDLDGQRRGEFIRTADWFPTHRKESLLSDSVGGELPSHIAGIWEDAHGLLWILSYVPDNRWIQAPRRERLGRLKNNASVAIRRGGYDMAIEVIDPDRGHLIASERFPGPERFPSRANRVLGRGHIRIWTEDGEGGGNPIRILRVRLEGYRGGTCGTGREPLTATVSSASTTEHS